MYSSSLRPGTRGLPVENDNFGINGTESKFGAHKEIISLKILRYKYCVNQSCDMSGDHFAKMVNY